MNHSNMIKYLTGFFCIVCISISCKKLIQISPNPPDFISTEAAFADSASVMSVIAGMYQNFGVGTTQTIQVGGITISTGLSGDDLIPILNDDVIYNNAIHPDNTDIGSLWSTAYGPLYQINACLKYIPASNGISAALKNQLIGEVKVVRALYYFSLVNLYGPVPLITDIDYNITQNLPRAPVDSVYSLIITDLADASQKLAETYPSEGRARPNVYVANALLAKVYLYTGKWKGAEDMANAVITAGIYKLENDLNNVFLEGSGEAIWQLPGESSYGQMTEATFFVPYASDIIPPYSLSASLLNTFEPKDVRRQKWIEKTDLDGTRYYYPYKYKTIDPAGPVEDLMILRLADVYLIRAEALAHENNFSLAVSDLNKIIKRAWEGAPGYKYTGALDQPSVLNAVLLERRKEFFAEWGNRWFDLKRTGAIDAVMSALKTGWQPADALYPVPKNEIANNPFLIQNLGY